MKVLVAEDNKESRYLLEKLLEGHGHEVTTVANGAEALAQALEQPHDVIISDIMMPAMDGFQLCQKCKQNEQLKNIPFIFYTATYTSNEDEKFALSLGADAFILKPAEPDIFIKILSEELEKAKHRSLAPAKVAPLKPSLYLFEYSKRIVAKLEQKVFQLETEITRRKQAEEKMGHLILVLRAIRNVNQLIITEKDRERLIQRACDNLTETRSYYNAWIVLMDEDGRYVLSAEAGLGKNFLPMDELLKKGGLPLCGRKALSQAAVVVTEDPMSTCTDCPFADMYSGKNAMIIRLEHGERIYGLLSVSIPADFVPSEEEQGLLEEVAGDIAFALYGIETEAERELAVEALRESKSRLIKAQEIVHMGDWEYDIEADRFTGSDEAYRISDIEPTTELSFEILRERIHPDDRDIMDKGTKSLLENGVAEPAELRILRPDGSIRHIYTQGEVAHNSAGKAVKLIGINLDITDRKLAEEKIKRSLKEKETLLAEIHHRVKNNMQIISSLLSLQSEDIDDENTRSLLKESESRVRSMALVHEKLYLSKDLSRIDFSDYAEGLAAHLFHIYRVDSGDVSFSSGAKDVYLDIEAAIPLGLIVNELVSNALKHAFPGGREGNIAVELRFNKGTKEFTLTVTDDGIGIPEKIDFRNTKTFGLQLVSILTEQLDASTELDRSGGTSFRITFRKQKYKKRI